MNEIKILVRTQNSTKAGMAEIDKAVDDLAKKASATFASRFTEELNKSLQQKLTSQLESIGYKTADSARRAGDRIGDNIGERASQRITTRINERLRSAFSRSGGGGNSTSGARSGGMSDKEKVSVDVDVDRQSLLSRFAGLGRDAAGRFGQAFQTAATSIFSGDIISTVIKTALVGLAGAALAPAIASAITSGVLLALGGGAIGIGVAGAFKDPRIKAAAKGTMNELKSMWEDFSSNFKGPTEDFFAPGKGEGSGLIDVIQQIKPMVADIGKAFGPLTKDLGKGVIGMLQNMLPGILRAVKASEPLIKVLADNLPGLGDEIGKFFDHIKNGAPDAAQFFDDFLKGVRIVIRGIGWMIEGFTRMYSIVRPFLVGLIVTFLQMVNALINGAAAAFGWIPGLGPKLRGAADKFNNFRDDVIGGLREIDNKDPTITVRFRVLGQAAARAAIQTARILSGLSHGGIKGAADGGVKAGMTWVGEHGPELVRLPPGAQVHSRADSARMAGGGGGSFSARVSVDRSSTSERDLVDALIRMLRIEIDQVAGGNVQQALGR